MNGAVQEGSEAGGEDAPWLVVGPGRIRGSVGAGVLRSGDGSECGQGRFVGETLQALA
ncbi:hypothetical protein [Streptomyces sp. SID7909]|uniref:hypothetical protein n=1 Tax=Streptomyces sp. SID7909 TaxID=2706092 RepID=UPI0013B84CA9|nr:hypothetical protein [Streptomyces sp. SID7909]NEC07956.1 hypothetical protein [Streptomyces sp. SID7909]